MAERETVIGRDTTGREVRSDGRVDGGEPTIAPRRWGPASWWRIGLLALLALLVGLALAGGAFWTAAPVEAPR